MMNGTRGSASSRSSTVATDKDESDRQNLLPSSSPTGRSRSQPGGFRRIQLSPPQLCCLLVVAMVFGVSISHFTSILTEQEQPQHSVGKVQTNDPHDNASTISTFNETTPLPHVIWLMSFPNSGTSYTLDMIRTASNRSVGTNYGDVHINYNTNASMPVHENDLDGPFWADQHMIRPTEYVLTKTHCTGYCNHCRPSAYLSSPHNFLLGCRGTKRIDSKGRVRKSVYSHEQVAKVIHILRNPFDNLVSRYHLEWKRVQRIMEREKDPKKLAALQAMNYTRDTDGFRRFCRDAKDAGDAGETWHDSRTVDQEVLALIQNVPCHIDVFRYVQWHNLANIVLRDFMDAKSGTRPLYTMHYEDYGTDFTTKKKELLKFCGLKEVAEPAEFKKSDGYVDYFTKKEQKAVVKAIRLLATHDTWEQLERYF